MADHKIVEHDVLIIGAGGAGLRAAIEAASAGVSVGLVCKSLLGKAHTVMAEGGCAAALANADERDSTSTTGVWLRSMPKRLPIGSESSRAGVRSWIALLTER